MKKSAIQVDSTYLAGPTGEVVLLWVHGDGLAGSGPRNVTVFARRPRWLGQVRGSPRGARERRGSPWTSSAKAAVRRPLRDVRAGSAAGTPQNV